MIIGHEELVIIEAELNDLYKAVIDLIELLRDGASYDSHDVQEVLNRGAVKELIERKAKKKCPKCNDRTMTLVSSSILYDTFRCDKCGYVEQVYMVTGG